MVIAILDLVPQCYSWREGEIVANAIRSALKSEQTVVLSFSGVDDVPSSFVNAAFVSLLNEYNFDEIRRRLSIVCSTSQINEMIKRRLSFESQRLKVA